MEEKNQSTGPVNGPGISEESFEAEDLIELHLSKDDLHRIIMGLQHAHDSLLNDRSGLYAVRMKAAQYRRLALDLDEELKCETLIGGILSDPEFWRAQDRRADPAQTGSPVPTTEDPIASCPAGQNIGPVDKPKIILAVEEAQNELLSATVHFGPMASAHEGYSVIKEELDKLWDEVKVNQKRRDIQKMRKEAVQVAAMAIRFIVDVCMK